MCPLYSCLLSCYYGCTAPAPSKDSLFVNQSQCLVPDLRTLLQQFFVFLHHHFFCLYWSFPILKQLSYPKNITKQKPSKSFLHFLPLSTSLSLFLLVTAKLLGRVYLYSVSPIPLLLFSHEPILITLLPVFLNRNCTYQSHRWPPHCQIQWLILGSHLICLIGSIWHNLLLSPPWTFFSLGLQDTTFYFSGCCLKHLCYFHLIFLTPKHWSITGLNLGTSSLL